jgi:putative ABC transport system permease protein
MATVALLRGAYGGGVTFNERALHVQFDPRPAAVKHARLGIPAGLAYADAMALERALSEKVNVARIGGNWLPTSTGESAALSMETVQAVDATFFEMFRAPLRYGAPWTAMQDRDDDRVAVLSAEVNARLFHGANSVGSRLTIDGKLFRVVGVLDSWNPRPRYFYLGDDPYAAPRGIYMPFSTWMTLPAGYGYGPMTCWNGTGDAGFDNPTSLDCGWIQTWVAARSGGSVANILSLVDGFAAEQIRAGRIASRNDVRVLSASGWLAQQQLVPDVVRLQNVISWGVLAVCIITAGGLMTARFARRRHELSLRRALGAPAAQILMQCFVEIVLIGAIAGAGSLFTTWLGVKVVRSQSASYAQMANVDASMVLVIVMVAFVSASIAGILPALRMARGSMHSAVKL